MPVRCVAQLPNGMKVCYKQTNFLDDQVLVSGFASGGLSEVPEADFNSASCAMLLVNEVRAQLPPVEGYGRVVIYPGMGQVAPTAPAEI